MSDDGTTSAGVPPRPVPPHDAPAWASPASPVPTSGAAAPQAAPWSGAAPQAPWDPRGQAPAWNGPSPFASPYAAAPPGSFPVAPPLRRSATLGIIALVAGLLAVVGASIAGALAGYQVGSGTGWSSIGSVDAVTGLGFLSPVREWVLVGEVAFWIGTALGLWALVQGIVAIATARGRAAGVIAVAVAVLGPVVFFTIVGIALGIGVEAYVTR